MKNILISEYILMKNKLNCTYIITNYNNNMKTWKQEFKNYKVDVTKYLWNSTWAPFFEQEHIKKIIEKINKNLSTILKEEKGDIEIFPYPQLIFDTFNTISLDDILLVCIGQDPYFNFSKIGNQITFVPESMGKCFSVPRGTNIPSSLKNIFKNLQKFNHFKFMPKNGDLTFWNAQGCLMLNTSLTVEYGHPNSHASYWKKLTDEFIKWISTVKKNLVFMLWGAPASKKKSLINEKNNHKIIISSHPCGMSCSKKMGIYEAFDNQDHFGIANEFLIKNEKSPIIWQIS